MIIHPNFLELEHGYAHDICLVKVGPMTLDNVNTGIVCLPSGDHVGPNVDVEEGQSSDECLNLTPEDGAYNGKTIYF